MKKLLFSFLFIAFQSSAQDAYEIIKRSDEHLRGASQKAEMSIEVQRPKWSRTMEIKAWSLGTEYSFILIQAPSRDKGTVFLKREKEIWNWQPKIEKVIKLPPSMMMQSWMGSDFTNDDLVKESSILSDYTHEIVGDTILQNRTCYSIKLTPKPEAAVVWGKIITFIDKLDYLQLGSEFYDEDGYLINKMEASDIKFFGDKILPAIMVMTPMEEENQKTILRYKYIEYNIDIEESFFTKQNMKSLR
jgi:outer membrane lipoprotein-sorting protein